MVVHIGRCILLSEQSAPSFCLRLLACPVVSCTGPHKPARLPTLEGGINSTLFKKGCVNRFKALLLNVSPLFHSVFVLRNTASCLITPQTCLPPRLSPSTHLSPSHHPSTRNFWPMSPLQHILISKPQLQPRNRTAFYNSGCPLMRRVPCASVLFQVQTRGGWQLYGRHAEFVKWFNSNQPFHFLSISLRTINVHFINKNYDAKYLITFFHNENQIQSYL